MKLNFSNLKNKTAFFQASLVFIILMLVDCLMTYSPYSAFHSGRVGAYSSSVSFFFNAAYVFLLSLFIAWIIKRRIYKDNIVYWLCAVMLISGTINRGLFRDTNTYLLDILTIFIVGTLAYDDSLRKKDDDSNYTCDEDFDGFYRLFLGLAVLGLLLVIVFPGKYGQVAFQFSRQSRGEVTIWQLFSVPVVITSSVLIKRTKGYKSKKEILFLALLWTIIMSTANRTQVIVLSICLIIHWTEQRMNRRKIIGLIIIVIILILGYSRICDFFLLGQKEINSETIATILTGRWGLWKYYWGIFSNNILWGYGPISIDAQLRRSLGAASEIGILKSVTTYGIMFGIIEIFILIKAIGYAICIIKEHENCSPYDNLMVYLFFSSVVFLLQQHSRILNYADFLFFYSSIYLYSKGRRLTKKV